MDDLLLEAVAQDWNGVRLPPERVAAHQEAVVANNNLVAAAALARLGVDRPPVYFDTFRAAHARSGRK